MRDLSASHVGKKHAVVADTVYNTKGVSELHRLHGPIAPLACPKPGATQQTGHAWSGHTVHPTCQRPANCQHKCLGTGHQTGCTWLSCSGCWHAVHLCSRLLTPTVLVKGDLTMLHWILHVQPCLGAQAGATQQTGHAWIGHTVHPTVPTAHESPTQVPGHGGPDWGEPGLVALDTGKPGISQQTALPSQMQTCRRTVTPTHRRP
jgi:hypothetical protein